MVLDSSIRVCLLVMRKIFITICFSLMLFLMPGFSASSALAADPDVIRISTEEYPPYTSKNLPHGGIDAHIVEEAFGAVGIRVAYEYMPGARSIDLAKSGEFDATLPWAHRKDREAFFHYPDPVIAVDDEFFYHRPAFRFRWNPAKPDYQVLSGKAVAAITGYDYGPGFQKAEKSGLIQVTRVRSLDLAFKMLELDRVDLVISKERVALHELSRLFGADQVKRFFRTREHISAKAYDYLIVSKKSAHASFFVKAFNRGMDKIRSNGRYGKILQDFADGKYAVSGN
jgi:polar amino acid transport system substrate-binding protein